MNTRAKIMGLAALPLAGLLDTSSAATAASATSSASRTRTARRIASRACHAALWLADGKSMTTVPTVRPPTTTGT
jgi:hypothetical protein